MKFMEKAKRFFTLKRRANDGFTLVELIVVIAILAILAGVAVPAYSGYIKKAEKAGDLQIVGAINEAFQAACMVQNLDARQITSASLDWNGKCVEGIESASGANVDATKLNADFLLFFAGNTTTEFKVLVEKISFKNGLFGEINAAFAGAYDNVVANMGGQVTNVQNSAFATNIGAEALLGQVVDVSSMAADLIYNGGDGSALTGVVLSDDYIKTMAGKLGKNPADLKTELETMYVEEPEKFAQYMANSTVLNVANTMNSMTTEEEATMKQNLANLSFGQLGTTLQQDPEAGLSQAALLYGMYTAFDPEGAKNLVDTKDVTALMNLGGKTNANGQTFADYIAQVNTEGSQAAKDYAGYKSALDIVNQSATNDKNVAANIMNNGYNDGDLLLLMQQVMGK